MPHQPQSKRRGLLKRGLSVAELEEGDILELDATPPVVVKTDASYEANFKNLEELGKGKFGVVYKAKRKSDGEVLAAKFVRKSASSKKEVTREIQMMNLLHHKRLIRLYDAYETKQDMIVVMELVTGGELFEKVVEEDNLTEKQVIRYMKQVLFGVQHMHRKQMVHLDLKPENILCLGGGKPGYEEIKLIDFGMTRVLKDSKQETAMCGTPEFVAPEVITFNPITVQADMWSIGVITYVLLSGLSPFMGDDDNETLKNVTSGEYDFDDDDEIFEHLSDDVKLFIQDLLILDPHERMSVDECLHHSWLRNEGSDKKLNTSNLKKFIARRRWQRTMNTIKAVSRLAGGLSLFGEKKVGAHGAGKGNFLSKVQAQKAAEEEEERIREEEQAMLKKKQEQEKKRKAEEEKARKEKEAAEKSRKEKEAAEKAQQKKEAGEKAQKEKEAAEKTRKEKEAAEKTRKEKETAEKARNEKEAAEKAKKEKEAAEKAQKKKEAVEKAQNEKEAAEKARKEKEATEKAQKEKEAAEKAEKKKEAVEKARKEKEAAEKARKKKEAAEKARKEKEVTEKAQKEKEAAEKVRKEKETAEKARKEKEAAEKARKEKEAAEKVQKLDTTGQQNVQLSEEQRKLLRDEERKRRKEERQRSEEINNNSNNSTSNNKTNDKIDNHTHLENPILINGVADLSQQKDTTTDKQNKPRQVIKVRPSKQININGVRTTLNRNNPSTTTTTTEEKNPTKGAGVANKAAAFATGDMFWKNKK